MTATARKNNLRLISVIIGENSIENRSQDTVKLLNYGFSNYKVNLIKQKGDTIGNIEVVGGKKNKVNLVLANDAIELLNVNDKITKYHYKISIKKLKAPIKRGKIVDYVEIYNDKNNLINKVPITIEEDILKAGILDYFNTLFKHALSFK